MKYQFETVSCNLCNSDNYELITTKGIFGLPTNVVICKDCGLTYLNPRWDHNSYLQFYKNDYDKYYRNLITEAAPVRKKQINPIEIRLRDFNLLPKNPARILDIGSGEGANLLHFKMLFQGSELHAIEPSTGSQAYLKQNGVTIIESDVDTSWDMNRKENYDFIILRHVLEHFLDPVRIMKKVKSVLTSSGIIYIAVPNNMKPGENLENHWFRNVHVYYFNKNALENLCKLVGLQIIEIVEGDKFNKGEVYLVARKSETVGSPDFSTLNYEKQLAVMQKTMKKDKTLLQKGVRFSEKVGRKIRRYINE